MEALHQRLDEVVARLVAIEAALEERDPEPGATAPSQGSPH
jgi:hypothetical protein